MTPWPTNTPPAPQPETPADWLTLSNAQPRAGRWEAGGLSGPIQRYRVVSRHFQTGRGGSRLVVVTVVESFEKSGLWYIFSAYCICYSVRPSATSPFWSGERPVG